MYVYIYIYIYVCVYIYMYIYKVPQTNCCAAAERRLERLSETRKWVSSWNKADD